MKLSLVCTYVFTAGYNSNNHPVKFTSLYKYYNNKDLHEDIDYDNNNETFVQGSFHGSSAVYFFCCESVVAGNNFSLSTSAFSCLAIEYK